MILASPSPVQRHHKTAGPMQACFVPPPLGWRVGPVESPRPTYLPYSRTARIEDEQGRRQDARQKRSWPQ